MLRNNYSPTIITLDPKREFPIIGVKIIDKDYADDFVKEGIVHFSDPKLWRGSDRFSGKQLDKDEGCFCFSTKECDAFFSSIGRTFTRKAFNNGWKYYDDHQYIVGACFYGVLKSGFTSNIMKYGVKTIQTDDFTVPIEYFKDFNSDADVDKRTIIILDFYRFYQMVLEAIINMGVAEEDIFSSTVYYVNKRVPFYTSQPFPFEYFLKDDTYSRQSELRIIITSNNKSFYELMRENNYNIRLGDISSFAIIQEYYKDDLSFSIQENKLIYNLAKPCILSLDERSFVELVSELYQIKQNLLPGEAKEQRELDKLAESIIEHLALKFSVIFRDDWRLYNVPRALFDELSCHI